MQLANRTAQEWNHEYIGTEHVIVGVLKADGMAQNLVKHLGGCSWVNMIAKVEKMVGKGPEMVTLGKLPQTPNARKVIEVAIAYARERNNNWIGTEHLLVGLLSVDGIAAQVLNECGVTLERTRQYIAQAQDEVRQDQLTNGINPSAVLNFEGDNSSAPLPESEIKRIREEFNRLWTGPVKRSALYTFHTFTVSADTFLWGVRVETWRTDPQPDGTLKTTGLFLVDKDLLIDRTQPGWEKCGYWTVDVLERIRRMVDFDHIPDGFGRRSTNIDVPADGHRVLFEAVYEPIQVIPQLPPEAKSDETPPANKINFREWL